jgi:hypothetical protein
MKRTIDEANVNTMSNNKMTSSITTSPYMTTKLQQRLGMLNDNPSKESLQTIARWCAFHRRPPKAQQICDAMLQSITIATSTKKSSTSTLKRALLYVSTLNEILMCDAPRVAGNSTPPDSSDKIFSQLQLWENLAPLRSLMGENVIVPVLGHLVKLMQQQQHDGDGDGLSQSQVMLVEECKESLLHMMDGWESVNAFDSPSLTEQLRTLVMNVNANVKMEQIRQTPDDVTDVTTTTASTIAPTTVASTTAEALPRADIPQAHQQASSEMSSDPDSINQAEVQDNSSAVLLMASEKAEAAKTDGISTTNADASADAEENDAEKVQAMDMEEDATSETKASPDGGEAVSLSSSKKEPTGTTLSSKLDDSSKDQQTSSNNNKSPAAVSGAKRRVSEAATTVFEKVDFEKEVRNLWCWC